MADYTGTYFTVDGITGWASRGVDANGVRWRHSSEISGWDEPPDARDNFTARTNAPGSFDAPVYDDNRIISWTGTAIAPSRAQREAAKLVFGRIARALRDGANVVGHDEDGDKTVWAKRSPGWKVRPFGPLGLQYQAQIVCPDPFKYGPSRSFSTGLPAAAAGGLVFPLFNSTGLLEFGASGTSGRVTLSNPGTKEAWPVFQVAGPVLGGFSITDVASGRQIVYGGDVPGGSTLLIIDAAAGRATLNGADRTGELTVKQWFSVPEDGADTGTGTLLHEAYLLDLGTDAATITSPDLVNTGTGVGTAQVATAVSTTVQFATFGPAGQTGTLTATVRPTYQ